VLTASLEDALARQHKCLSIGQPDKSSSKALKAWLDAKKPLLDPQDDGMMEKEEGLVGLKVKDEQDRLSRIIRDNMGLFLGWFHQVWVLYFLPYAQSSS
jgi:hypothetical protein